MKTITIGRGEGCDIFIDDYRISRRHAILKVYTFGKMEIVDMGQNGTWVNGVKLRPGVPFPVKRKDVINFAEASQLNWAQVENPMKYVKIVGGIIGALLLLGLLALWISSTISKSTPSLDYSVESSVNAGQPPVDNNYVSDSLRINDSLQVQKPDTDIKHRKAKSTPKTVQELFPQKAKEKGDLKPQKAEKGKAGKEKPKSSNNKKTDKKDTVYEIL
jgi:hypothetical protein